MRDEKEDKSSWTKVGKEKKNEKGCGHECHFLILMINIFLFLYIHESLAMWM